MSKSQQGKGATSGGGGGGDGFRLAFLPQLSHSARQAKAEAEVPGPEEASVSPVEAFLCFQRSNPFSAEAVQPRINSLGPGRLRHERPLAGRGQAWFQ